MSGAAARPHALGPTRGAAAGVIALALVGCGSPAPDLFSVARSGRVPGAALTLIVSDDGSTRCDAGSRRRISDSELLAARQLEHDLDPAATNGVSLAPGASSVLSYSVQTSAGHVRFSDTSAGITPAFERLAAFVHELAQRACGRRL